VHFQGQNKKYSSPDSIRLKEKNGRKGGVIRNRRERTVYVQENTAREKKPKENIQE
jgi:hypothetical protein